MDVKNNNITELLDIKEIYFEPEVKEYARGEEILGKYSQAKLIEVPSHWKIPHLYGNEGSIGNWNQIKRNVLVLGIKKSMTARENCRSSHYVAPSQANGCTMACSYCYVPRRKGYANPVTVFVNIEKEINYLKRHAAKLGLKTNTDDQIDPEYWVYEIGENSDCSVDASICDNIKDLINFFKETPNVKGTFATKYVNYGMLFYDPGYKTRLRFSLMPQKISKIIDVRTSPISQRIDAINDFYRAGYEVHLNFAPVVYYDGWLEDYKLLFQEIDGKLDQNVKDQLKSEIIFLTHNQQLHDVNMGWHPKAEELLWTPELQEVKYSQTGGRNVRYKRGLKGKLVDEFLELLNREMPYCTIRYAF